MARPVLRTWLCDFLGIEYPIMLAGMGTLTGKICTPPSLVAAVSEAGGIGVLGTTSMTPEVLTDNIREIRKLTSRPFGVDMLLPERVAPDALSIRSQAREQIRQKYPQHWDFVQSLRKELNLPEAAVGDEKAVNVASTQMALLEVCFREKIDLFAAALGAPDWLAPRAHAQGMKVLALAGNVRHAVRHKKAGVDFVVATGTEAGGHTGRIATMPLVPQVVDAISPLPVVAGGGIGDGRQLAAALALGAVGVWVGTAFLVSEESEIGDRAKDLLIAAESGDVDTHTLYTGKPMRGLKNRVTEAWKDSGLQALPLPFQKVMMDDFQLSAHLSEQIELEANPGGQIVGMLKQRKPAATIVREMVELANDTFARLDGFRGGAKRS